MQAEVTRIGNIRVTLEEVGNRSENGVVNLVCLNFERECSILKRQAFTLLVSFRVLPILAGTT